MKSPTPESEPEIMDPLPEIDAKLCTGCKACVEICPTQALSQVANKAVLHRPDLCTYCTACQDVCPENAIALPFMIVFAKPASAPAMRLA